PPPELARAHDANQAVLQHMTDAETGVRGFQLTGDEVFLAPYDTGRAGAFTAFDVIAAHSDDSAVRRSLTVERAAASQWLSAYAVPIVNAGVADRASARPPRGKSLFDAIRTANADVDAAIRAEQRSVVAADRH